MCDHPDATYEDYLQLVLQTIEETGWFVQAVQGDRLHPPFAYTVGLTQFGFPELVVSGLSYRKELQLLNSVATHMVFHDGGRLIAGEHVPQLGWPDIEVVNLSEPSAHLYTAVNLFGSGVEAQQLVYADDRGQWPWYIGFRGRQRVLGPRAKRAA